jgi:starch synthase
VPLVFNERLEHRLLAGADLLLMPSRFEPCGLTQMRAQRYGTLPIVRRVGGLSDTVRDGETGFVFGMYTPHALQAALRRAIDAYQDRHRWPTMVTSAMHEDFSWDRSLTQYNDIYRRALGVRSRGEP